jgi:hypothetical protein
VDTARLVGWISVHRVNGLGGRAKGRELLHNKE